MDPAQNESKSTEPVLAIELASETPKAVSTPKILQDEAQSTPLAAIPEDDESSSHSVDPVAAVDRSAPPDDGGSLKGTIAEAGSASSVFKPPKAKDMDSVKRSLDLVDDSIEGLHVANDTTKETPTNLQTTHEKTSAKVIKRKNAVTDVPTSPDAETVKDSESQVNSKEPATAPPPSSPQIPLSDTLPQEYPKAEVHWPQAAELREHSDRIVDSVYHWTRSNHRSETEKLFLSTWGETRAFYRGWQGRIREVLAEFERCEGVMRERLVGRLGTIACEEMLWFEEGCLREEKVAAEGGEKGE